MTDPVTKPAHYQFYRPCREVRDVIDDRVAHLFRDDAPAVEYNKADLMYDYINSIKYLLRAFEKNGLEDLRKAQYCIGNMIFTIEKQAHANRYAEDLWEKAYQKEESKNAG